MICVVIKGPTFELAKEQISRVSLYADLIELRLDCFHFIEFTALEQLRQSITAPLIFTLRPTLHGGQSILSEDSRLQTLFEIAALKPSFIDIESDVSPAFIKKFSSHYPEIKIILSYHNFLETPRDLDDIYKKMQKISASYYKIAVMAKNCLDALYLISWAKQTDSHLIAISMGNHGQISRILSSVIGNPFTYASLEENPVCITGQLSVSTLINHYNYLRLNSTTAIYGLIGDPVIQSIGHITHNRLFKHCGFNAVYIKILVHSSDLSDFIFFAKESLLIKGLSVTMPLKELVVPLMDEITSDAKEIGAINTLLFKDNKIFGFNTDGIGALTAIEKLGSIQNKHIVLLGAGGAAKAIAKSAISLQASVTIVNRDKKKALQLSEKLNCHGMGLNEMAVCAQNNYHILVNCTSHSLPINPLHILPGKIVMDIQTKPKKTDFIAEALKKNCQVVYGYQMFVEQALDQFEIWFKDKFNKNENREYLEKSVLDCLTE